MALSTQDELILLRKRARRRLVGAVVLVSIATVVLWNVVGHLPEQQMKPESIEIMGGASAPVPTQAQASRPASAPAAVPHAASQPLAEAPAVAKPGATELAANLSAITEPKADAPAQAAPPVKSPASLAAATAKPEHKPEPKPKAEPKPEPKAEKPRKQADPAAILEGRFDAEAKPEAKPKADSAAGGKSVIQLAALSDPAKVDAMRAKLQAAGVSAHFSKVETSKGEVTRVRVGPFNSHAEAQAALQKLSKAGINGIIVSK